MLATDLSSALWVWRRFSGSPDELTLACVVLAPGRECRRRANSVSAAVQGIGGHNGLPRFADCRHSSGSTRTLIGGVVEGKVEGVGIRFDGGFRWWRCQRRPPPALSPQ